MLCSARAVIAQEIAFELQVDPNPPVYAYQWEQNPELIMIQAINFSTGTVPVKLKGWLYNSAGDLLGETDDYAIPPITLQPELNIIYPIEIIPGSALIFYGDFEDEIIRTNRIPEGEYLLCAAFIHPETFQPLTQQQCASFFIQGYDPPFLVYPPDGAVLTQAELDNTVFTWTPVSPQPFSFMPYYRFGLVEMFEGQEPREALLSNPMIFEETVQGETQFAYPYELLLPTSTNTFVWSVQVLNENFDPLTGGDGWSEPFIFTLPEDTIIEDTTGSVLIPGPSLSDDTTMASPDTEPDTIIYIPVTEEDSLIGGPDIAEEVPGTDTIPTPVPRMITDPTRPPVADSTRIPRMISDPTRPAKDTIPPIEEWPPPPIEEIPPDTITLEDKCLPSFLKDIGIPISVGMNLSQPAKFDYPRAVPIRAEGIDLDYAIFRCEGCDGLGEFKKAVEDHVDRFTWKLDGPGSLNTPFDLEELLAAEDSLKNILERLDEIEDSLKLIGEKLAELPGKIESAQKRLGDNEKEQQEKDSLLNASESRKDSIASLLDSLKAGISGQRNQILSLNDSIDARQDLIDSLNRILSGEPTEEMLRKLEDIGRLRDELKVLKENLENKEQEISEQGEQLLQAIGLADSTLEIALDQYQALQKQAEGLSKGVTERQTTLMSNPLYRQYWKARRSWDQQVNQFNYYYLTGDTSSLLVAERQMLLKQQATSAVSVANKATRLSRFIQFDISMNSFKLLLATSCYHLSGDDLSDCMEAASLVREASDGFRDNLDTLVQSSYLYNHAISQEQDSLRQLLADMETSIENAKQAVEERNEELESARQEYVDEMNRLEDERRELKSGIASLTDSLGNEELVYEKMEQAQADTLNNNREKYLGRIHQSNLSINEFNTLIYRHSDTLGRHIADSVEAETAKAEISRQIEEQKTYIDRLKALHDNLESLIEKYEEEQDWLEKRKLALEKEREELQKEKEELEESQEQKFEGNKTATGLLVYYIPPPLEEVMKNKEEFERLKKEVELAEDSLAMAYEFKQLVQKKLVREIDKIARNLVKFNEMDSLLSGLESRKQEVAIELATAKNQQKMEYQEYQQELQRILGEAAQQKEKAQDYLEDYENDSIAVQETLDDIKENLELKDSLVARLERNMKDMAAQLNYEKDILENARKTLDTRNESLAAERNQLISLKEELGRQQNELTRAHAKDNAAEVRAAEQQITALESQVQASETRIASLENEVRSASGSVESAVLRVNNAETSLDNAIRQLTQARKERMVLEDQHIEQGEVMEEVLSGLNHWRLVEEKAQQLEDKTNDARAEFEEKINEQVNEEDEVASLQKELDNIEKGITDAQNAQTDLVTAINKSIEKKDEIIDEADERLEAAKEKLEEANDDLRDFLLNEFNTVNFSVKLELEGDDRILDGYRTDDKSEKILNTLSYKGSRTPFLPDIKARGSLPDQMVPSSCTPDVSFVPGAPPVSVQDPVEGREPRTIALVYREGRPLWPEWPVIPPSTPLIAKDVVPVTTVYSSDMDQKIHPCISNNPDCKVPPPLVGAIVDLGRYTWTVEGAIINQHPLYNQMMWETPYIQRPYPEAQKEIKSIFTAASLAGDPPADNKSKPTVKPGALVEVTDSLVGVPEKVDTVVARVVTGDHKGLAGEDIEFSLVRVAGYAKGYGFSGTDTLKVEQTDGDGYARVPFHFGEGFAEFKIYARWKRGETIMDQDELKAISPIRLQFLKFSAGAGAYAWEPALELFEAGQGAGAERIREVAANLELPDNSDSTKDVPVHALVGLLDEERDFVEDEVVIFEPPPDITLEPDSATTAAFGIARTKVEDLPADAKILLLASVEEKFADVGRPGSDKSELSTTKIEKFRIGTEDNPFVIILDDPVSEGETVTGTGKLSAELGGDIIISLLDISLDLTDIELEGDIENKKAISGAVAWSGSPGLSYEFLSFGFTLDSLVIYPARGARIEGSVAHPSLTNAVEFAAELDPSGNFMGTISELPPIEMLGFKLIEGTSFTLDMDRDKNVSGFDKDEFKGVIIHQVGVELPKVFNTNEKSTPSVLQAQDLYIGTAGVGGTVSYSGTLLSLGFSGYGFEVDNVSVTFENDSVLAASLGGKISLPSPFEGTISGTVSLAGNSWTVAVQTEDPVSIPRLATTFTLLEGTGAEYNEETQVATFRLDAVISSEDYGDMTIQGFIIDSEGNIQAEEIAINKAIEFGSGFALEVNSLSFRVAGEEYDLALKGGFSFPLIGADSLKGTVTISPGPTIGVAFDKAEISFNYSPVNFKGSFAYSANEFKGEFSITLENLKYIEGISGLLIVGNGIDQAQVAYTYWYAEMVLSGAVPLGQTGLSLLQLGAGLGYNYNPPVGSQPGSPSNSDAFSFKAIIGMGTAPGGEVMAGRMEMILAPGYFTLYGKLWLLQQEENMYGEGSISLFWAPVNKFEGFVGMFVGIPDADGDIFLFEGKINFLYSAEDAYIRSEKIEGSFLHALQARASVDITGEHTKLDGELSYHFNESIGTEDVRLIVVLDVDASGHFHFYNATSTLNAGVGFHGSWDVDAEALGIVVDIISGSVDLDILLEVTPVIIRFEGSAEVSWQVLWVSGTVPVDVGFEIPL